MAKRTATSDLNHDNWDREEDPEDAGTFKKAKDDDLKKRVIKVAKRRNPISSVQNEEEKTNAFGGFSGFAKSTPTTNFGFLSNLTKPTNGTSETDKLDEYYAKLKGLNESVTEWIKTHVSANPYINLQPVFKDYDKYIAELEKLKSETESDSQATTVTAPQFSFGSVSSSQSKFSFGSSESFSFGNPSSNGKFSFATTAVSKPAAEEEQEEDQDEPPKVEFTPVEETGHVYATRCKVFVKKDGTFADHGVGGLYIKPVPDSEKFQLFVRAETNLGKLICNFILSEGIPMQRMGKKDVMLVCIPTADAKPPPVPVLLRVKSAEEADQLLDALKKHQK